MTLHGKTLCKSEYIYAESGREKEKKGKSLSIIQRWVKPALSVVHHVCKAELTVERWFFFIFLEYSHYKWPYKMETE